MSKMRIPAICLTIFLLGTMNMPEATAQSSYSETATNPTQTPRDPVVAELLMPAWQAYRQKFITSAGRVTDLSANSVTTSEGQSYALLRAVWMDDEPTFDKVWAWTAKNLQRQSDKLFGWKWGTGDNGKEGLLDRQTATEADQGRAFALRIGSEKWNRPEFATAAKQIIDDVWKIEVTVVQNVPYITAGDWAAKMTNPRLNPSYFAPYIYRLFAASDTNKNHDWKAVIDSSYDVLKRSSELSFVKLPPDWCTIDSTNGLVTTEKEDKASDYSYDAMRVPWRMAVDFQLNNEPRAREIMERMVFLRENWKVNHKIQASYTSYGVIRSFDEPLATFGCALPMFGMLDPEAAKQILTERVFSVYKDGLFQPEYDYYNNNWIWFGLASFAGAIKI